MNDLTRRLLFVVLILLIYRIGAHIPVPLVDTKQIMDSFSDDSKNIFSLFNLFSGGALLKVTIFSLGIMPYISASIVIQLLASTWLPLKKIQKEGGAGRRKISNYTRYLTVILAFVQAVAMSKFILHISFNNNLNLLHYSVVILTLVSGTLFLMWLGEQINEKGIGNGVSLIIFTSIVSNIPRSFASSMEKMRQGEVAIISMIIFAIVLIFIILLIVFIEKAQRRILVNYPKRQQGRRMYAAQSSYLPFKINMSGVIPPIFASSVILFPVTLLQWIDNSFNFPFLKTFIKMLMPGSLLYIILFGISIVFFSFFYTNLVFKSKDTADNLKKSGGFISGIRPGNQTSTYIDKIINKLTYLGAFYLSVIALIPEFFVYFSNIPFYFGGTSLLIIVVVIMDFISQVQGKLISSKYDNILKKHKNFKF